MRIKYHYKGRLTLFSNFNYTFYPQKITAIAGESGSGKSTLASLLLRLYLPDEGSITLGGIPAEDIPLPLWRQWISLVPQQPAIIEGTLYDNIVYGCTTHSPQDVAQLCDLLGLTSFIEQLPQGLFTHLGEQGAQLSGGQRQRIALARAAYRRPKWLIMDEATSSLDSSSEGFIFNAITQWHREGMGIIIIAHRLSSLSIAHQILLLKEGAIAGEGSHATLLSTNEQYAAWCRQQAI